VAVPDTEQEQEFIIEQDSKNEETGMRKEKGPVAKKTPQGNLSSQNDDFDLSDLSVKPKEKSREDIIAEAEAAAFAEAEG
jgi:ribonuclease-3